VRNFLYHLLAILFTELYYTLLMAGWIKFQLVEESSQREP